MSASHDPVRRDEHAIAWELRKHWALLHEVTVTWPDGTVRGYVQHVAPTDAFCLVFDGHDVVHVPLLLLPSVARTHFHHGPPVAAPPTTVRVPFQLAGQLSLWAD